MPANWDESLVKLLKDQSFNTFSGLKNHPEKAEVKPLLFLVLNNQVAIMRALLACGGIDWKPEDGK